MARTGQAARVDRASSRSFRRAMAQISWTWGSRLSWRTYSRPSPLEAPVMRAMFIVVTSKGEKFGMGLEGLGFVRKAGDAGVSGCLPGPGPIPNLGDAARPAPAEPALSG